MTKKPNSLRHLGGATRRTCRGSPNIKVITGVRRSGKAKLMEALALKILERQPNANPAQPLRQAITEAQSALLTDRVLHRP